MTQDDDCRCILCMIRGRIIRETLADCPDEQLAALQRHAEITAMDSALEDDRSDCGGQTVSDPPCGGCGACMRKQRDYYARAQRVQCTHCGAEDGVCYSWCFSKRKVTP